MKLRILIAALSVPLAMCKPVDSLNVADHGAIGDGLTLNTERIQAVVDRAAAAGGGTVVIPPGTFLTGTIFFPSNVSLHLSEGSVLQASPDINDYIEYTPDKALKISANEDQAKDPGSRGRHFLVFAKSEGIAISGKGRIDGNGHSFWDENWKPLERPSPFIVFDKCANVSIRDIRITNSPSHTMQFLNCDGVVVDGIHIVNPLKSPNTDGIDINDTRNVRIANCFMRSGDDLICLKSQKDTVENVVVTNCVLESDDAAIKFGTGSRVATRYCSFSNIVVRKSRYGIALFMLDGGVFEHNTFRNISIESGGRADVHFPIFADIDKRVADRPYGKIRHNIFDGIQIISGGKVLISGHPEQAIEDLALSNVRFRLLGEQDFSNASKPRGNKNFPAIETSTDLSREAANVVLGHISGGFISNITISGDASSRSDVFHHAVDMEGIATFTAPTLQSIKP